MFIPPICCPQANLNLSATAQAIVSAITTNNNKNQSTQAAAGQKACKRCGRKASASVIDALNGVCSVCFIENDLTTAASLRLYDTMIDILIEEERKKRAALENRADTTTIPPPPPSDNKQNVASTVVSPPSTTARRSKSARKSRTIVPHFVYESKKALLLVFAASEEDREAALADARVREAGERAEWHELSYHQVLHRLSHDACYSPSKTWFMIDKFGNFSTSQTTIPTGCKHTSYMALVEVGCHMVVDFTYDSDAVGINEEITEGIPQQTTEHACAHETVELCGVFQGHKQNRFCLTHGCVEFGVGRCLEAEKDGEEEEEDD